jgi:two-component system, response regulator, stage 0 sporulation protein F
LGRKRYKILIVDDEENARFGLSKLLSQEGYDVESVANGYEALDYLRRKEVHLVVSDIKMPRMDGITFLKEINRHYPSTHVIMITAFGEVESYLEAMNLGAFEYIHKPVKLDELKAVMRKIFDTPESAHFP